MDEVDQVRGPDSSCCMERVGSGPIGAGFLFLNFVIFTENQWSAGNDCNMGAFVRVGELIDHCKLVSLFTQPEECLLEVPWVAFDREVLDLISIDAKAGAPINVLWDAPKFVNVLRRSGPCSVILVVGEDVVQFSVQQLHGRVAT